MKQVELSLIFTWRFLLPTLKLRTQSPVAWVGSSRTNVLWSIETWKHLDSLWKRALFDIR